ncbi:hypothetical protein CC1G_07944 [Coprinopsis cinerea okayama7|uniref:Uncharacterized protein n=1 Tax=Coprinopsis cinerea (strain Okayama-7 / 130 / ATCC MYA-4618 / FGSC 9003) TaxID=240176 RepID=A8P1Z1_COPC7|nr:hypothetical protein CC1G_07944 [Coprinopsis cinerea okayama7\|eukprot:XP_001838203.2 hypothetical protein CC1G_07944 [Coprinopsis cinerea okayama7\
MLIAALLMLIFASFDIALTIRLTLKALTGSPTLEQLQQYFHLEWTYTMRVGCYVGQTFMGDSILLYRLWVVYDRRWSVALVPTILWLGYSVLALLYIYGEEVNRHGHVNWFTLQLFVLSTSMLVTTLVMNLLTTGPYSGLIVFELWRVQSRVKPWSVSVSPLWKLGVIFIQSGLLYTANVLIFAALFIANHNGQAVMLNVLIQIIGITFNLIITIASRAGREKPAPTSTNFLSKIRFEVVPETQADTTRMSSDPHTSTAFHSTHPSHITTAVCSDSTHEKGIIKSEQMGSVAMKEVNGEKKVLNGVFVPLFQKYR